jgi:hypothetical protein
VLSPPSPCALRARRRIARPRATTFRRSTRRCRRQSRTPRLRRELAHHESGRLVYGADRDESLEVVAQRELARLLGLTASLADVVGEALREPVLLANDVVEEPDDAPGADPKPRRRAR